MTNITIERNGTEVRFYRNGLFLAKTETTAETKYVLEQMTKIYKTEKVFAQKSAEISTIKKVKKLLES